MAVFKCKMCGGDLILTNEAGIAECDSCGSLQTVPNEADEKKANLINRANKLRMNRDFDRAAALYESVAAEYKTEAEAYWGALLCRYGIEYVDDPATDKKVPTCHRASYDSVLKDEDYTRAVEYASGEARAIYVSEGERIEKLRTDILEIVKNEPPFDVFICYKERDASGGRTKDSVLAQDIYYALSERGMRVFFARITLEDKLGIQFEPYIFAALNSARVMLTVATSVENLTSPWVKNEWSRYLRLMASDKSRTLLPCYKDMEPDDMPEVLSILQSQDMGKIGFMQDLVRGVEKLLGRDKKNEPAQQVIVQQVNPVYNASSETMALLRRGELMMEDGEFAKAENYFERVLDAAPECAAAYWGKLCCKLKAKNDAAVIQHYRDLALPTLKTIQVITLTTRLSAQNEERLNALKADARVYRESDIPASALEPIPYPNCRAMTEQAMAIMPRIEDEADYAKALRFASEEEGTRYKAAADAIAEFKRKTVCSQNDGMIADGKAKQREYDARVSAAIERAGAAQDKRRAQLAAEEAMVERIKLKAQIREGDDRITGLECSLEENMRRIARKQSVFDKLINGTHNDQKYIDENKEYHAELDECRAAMEQAENRLKKLDSECSEDTQKQLLFAMGQLAMAKGDDEYAMSAFLAADGYSNARDFALRIRKKLLRMADVRMGKDFVLGLKANGTVFCAVNESICRAVASWRNIVAIDAADDHCVGLTADGHVLEAGGKFESADDSFRRYCTFYDAKPSIWRNIVQISTGTWCTLGLRADGRVECYGWIGSDSDTVGCYPGYKGYYADKEYHAESVSSWQAMAAVLVDGMTGAIALDDKGELHATEDRGIYIEKILFEAMRRCRSDCEALVDKLTNEDFRHCRDEEYLFKLLTGSDMWIDNSKLDTKILHTVVERDAKGANASGSVTMYADGTVSTSGEYNVSGWRLF